MNREFLKSAGVPDDAIDRIMAEYGKDLQAEKEKAAKVLSDLAERERTIETYKTQVSELEKTAGENTNVKKQLEDLKAQIEKEAPWRLIYPDRLAYQFDASVLKITRNEARIRRARM